MQFIIFFALLECTTNGKALSFQVDDLEFFKKMGINPHEVGFLGDYIH